MGTSKLHSQPKISQNVPHDNSSLLLYSELQTVVRPQLQMFRAQVQRIDTKLRLVLRLVM